MSSASDKIKKKLGTAAKTERKLAHKDTRRKPGLLHAARAIQVEEVNSRMRVPCRMCGEKPEVRRLVLKTGSGRMSKSEVYCIADGWSFLNLFQREVERASDFLVHGYVNEALRTDAELGVANVGIRLPKGTSEEDLCEDDE